ncbi:MAG: DUF1611 domain-containing protein [Deltaproteobacteria bacterium]|nr:DUF1611 domain-containing protein [Deltaproteobacteria bacterium]
MNPQPALVLTNGHLRDINAKTCHGLLRGSDRFTVLAVIDGKHAGSDAGSVLDGQERGIPVYESVESFFRSPPKEEPRVLVVGVAFPGGKLPDSARGDIGDALRRGLGVISGLHQLIGDDEEFSQLAQQHGVDLVDIRRPPSVSDLSFWNGSIYQAKAKRVAVLGTDCAIGKRTTCRFLLEACRTQGLATEMIYTGQTGWMQGYPHGLILDSLPNDFVSGELERAVVACDRELSPELILIEGQSALRNPSGPCGSELLLSTAAHGAILQHAPGRTFFVDQDPFDHRLPSAEKEVALILAYGVPVLAVTLHEEGMEPEALEGYRAHLEDKLGLPVVRPLVEGVGRILPTLRALL